MALIEIEPVSLRSLVGRAISGMGTYIVRHHFWLCASVIHWLVSTLKVYSESMHWPVSCRTCSCGHTSRWRLLNIDTWCIFMTEAVTLSNLIELHWFLRYGSRRNHMHAHACTHIRTHTHRHKHTDFGLVEINFSKVTKALKTTKITGGRIWEWEGGWGVAIIYK